MKAKTSWSNFHDQRLVCWCFAGLLQVLNLTSDVEIVLKNPIAADVNNALVSLYVSDPLDILESVLYSTIGELIRAPFFDTVRTVNMDGYVASASIIEMPPVSALGTIVQVRTLAISADALDLKTPGALDIDRGSFAMRSACSHTSTASHDQHSPTSARRVYETANLSHNHGREVRLFCRLLLGFNMQSSRRSPAELEQHVCTFLYGMAKTIGSNFTSDDFKRRMSWDAQSGFSREQSSFAEFFSG